MSSSCAPSFTSQPPRSSPRRSALTLGRHARSRVDFGNKVDRICDLVRHDLQERGDTFHWANTILTAHVRKRPPAYEDALKVLVDLKGASTSRPATVSVASQAAAHVAETLPVQPRTRSAQKTPSSTSSS